MKNSSLSLKALLRNQYAIFTFVRYTSYALQFARAFFYAKFLGPYLFGVWGLIALYQQYLAFSSFGVHYSLNAELALNMNADQKTKERIISSSFFLVILIIIVLALISTGMFASGLHHAIFSTHFTAEHFFILMVVIALQHFQQLFTNIFRITSQLLVISFTEFMVAFLTLIVVFFFDGEQLIRAYLITWAISLLLANLLFLHKKTFKFTVSIPTELFKRLFLVGLPLLVYNFSFHLMTLGSRTVIGFFYPVHVLGYYSLAHSISSAVLLGLDAVGWIFFPKLISKVKEGIDDKDVLATLKRAKSLYSTAAFTVIFLAILVSPLIYLSLPEYKDVQRVLNIMLLTQGFLAMSFVHVTLAISRRRQNSIAILALVSTGIATGLGLTFAVLDLHFQWIAISALIGSVVFYWLTIRISASAVTGSEGAMTANSFPPALIIPAAIFLVGVFLAGDYLYFTLGFMVFSYFNRSQFVNIIDFVKNKLHETGA